MRNLLLICAIIGAILAVNKIGYEDEQLEQAHSCRMVKSGAWPEYFCKQ